MKQLYAFRLVLVSWLAATLLLLVGPAATRAVNTPAQPAAVPASNTTATVPSDFFGVVVRDPWYEWNTNPRYGGSNLEFLENMARNLKAAGARYVRIEFRADQTPGVRGGAMNYARYDAFINDIAPRYGLKVLGLLGYALVNWDAPTDKDLHYRHYNDPPDQTNGSNPLIRFFAFRARDVIAHYGDRVSAWEVLNEINYWEGVSLNPNMMANLMVYTYGLGKSANPNTQIIVGAQVAPPPAGQLDTYQYLDSFFHSEQVQKYIHRARPAPYNDNPYPWDGLAWHPYHTGLNDAVSSVRKAVTLLRSWGDQTHKIWITEVGRPGNLSAGGGGCGGPGDEGDQARYLTDFYTQLIGSNLNDIANIFWFKYEDFYDTDTGQLNSFGLVHLQTDARNNYLPGGQVAKYKAAFFAYQRLSAPAMPLDPVPPPPVQSSPANPTAPFYFPQTGHTLVGPFLNYWLKNGGLELFGFPLTEPFEELNPADGKSYLVQYFQRERFEYHPQNQPPYDVLMGLLGNDLLQLDCRGFTKLPPPADPLPEFRTYFAPTGHYLSFRFKAYWNTHGGLAIFGYPVSEEFEEVSPIDGKTYVVQYFERARFELHPDAPPDTQVLLALLGTELLKRRNEIK